jgi:hypothetical protein
MFSGENICEATCGGFAEIAASFVLVASLWTAVDVSYRRY